MPYFIYSSTGCSSYLTGPSGDVSRGSGVSSVTFQHSSLSLSLSLSFSSSIPSLSSSLLLIISIPYLIFIFCIFLHIILAPPSPSLLPYHYHTPSHTFTPFTSLMSTPFLISALCTFLLHQCYNPAGSREEGCQMEGKGSYW